MQHKLKELIIIRGFVDVAVLTLSHFVMPVCGIIGVGFTWPGVVGVVSIVLTIRLGTWTKRFSRTKGDNLIIVNYF